jgi:NADH:ubiquinone oxidoreductase subunit F (NADH-binding)/NADH:ubiquinone oxidoreductase subunit E
MQEATSNIRRFEHPGRGGRARPVPKGRQVDPRARAEVEALLGDQPRRRDLLIEHLHLIQDAHRQISAAHLGALADLMGLAHAEAYEVATFYAHFDVVREGDTPVPALTVRVCDGISCELAGAAGLHAALAGSVGAGVRVVRAPCVGRCDTAPAVEVGHNFIDHATAASVLAAVASGDTHTVIPPYTDYETYVVAGGYATLRRLRDGALTSEQVLDELDAASLRGLGGAGFPTGRKWRAVRGEPGPRYMVVNADEGEPGTFKDRYHLEREPHRFLEGMLIGAHIVEATEAYIYLRDEYPAANHILATEIAKLPPGPVTIHIRRGAGAYICGEESAMLESLEGKRGLPRHKPPFPYQFGLFGQATLINNVETLYWIPEILGRGAAWWNSHEANGRKGLKSYSVSGRVKQPKVVIAPGGTTVRELIDTHCGGMLDGHRFSAYLPGGASGGILPASMDDIPLDFGTLEKYGCFIGSAAIVIFSDQDDVRAVALNLMRFFEDESCGQCTPCRAGTQKARMLMGRGAWDAALLGELGQAMRDASICGLGQAASNPLACVIKYFPESLAPQEAAQ